MKELVLNVVLSGYPCAGKTKLARRLVSDTGHFVRVGADDLRGMMFEETYPSRDENTVFQVLMAGRDRILRQGKSAVVDTSAPNNRIRGLLLSTRVKHATPILVVVDADRKRLIERNCAEGRWRTVEQWDRYWEKPRCEAKIIRFRSNSPKGFETSYHSLVELLDRKLKSQAPRNLARKKLA